MTYTWAPLKVGAGGQLTGISIAPDGTKAVRTDTMGGYVWNASAASPGNAGGTGRWDQLVTTASMPAGDWSQNAHQGIYEIAVASSATSTFYMLWNGFMYKSTNSGVTWARLTGFNSNAQLSPIPNANAASVKLFGRFMAVDPQNASIVYVGTPSGSLWTTSDGGTTWSTVAGITAPTNSSGYLIAFDPNSSVSGGKQQGIYVSSYGTGVYHSTNGGTSFTLTSSGPTTHRHMVVAPNGTVWVTSNVAASANIWRFTGGTTWANMTGKPNDSGNSIAIDPTNSNKVYVGDTGSVVGSVTTDGGTTWANQTNVASRTAADIPWLADSGTIENSMTNGDAAFDPSLTNTIIFAEGIGVWKCVNPPTTNAAYSVASMSAGIEQLVGQTVLCPPSGKPIVLSQDRPLFYSADPNVYPSNYKPSYSSNSIIHGWDADWVAGTPATVVAIMNNGTDVSGISTDGGQTWTQFASKPPITGNGGGCIAAASTTNVVWGQNANGDLYYTTNGATSWNKISISGVPASPSETGWGFSAFSYNRIVCADRVDADTFYAYNYGPTGAASAKGIYKSTDEGVNWTHVYTNGLATQAGASSGSEGPALLRAVPGQSGHLFICSGGVDSPGATHPAGTEFLRSTDHGATWTKITGFAEVSAFAFGVTYSGQSYPSIFCVGWLNGVYGVWRSIDNAVTWTQLGTLASDSNYYPGTNFDFVRGMDADKVTQGTVYLAFGGSGWAVGTENTRVGGLRFGLHS